MKHKGAVHFLAFFAAIFFFAISCKKKEDTISSTTAAYEKTPYDFKVPEGFPVPDFPDYNSMTVEGVDLGRHFFYDPILSSNGMTCSTCHNPEHSFSSPYFTTQAGDIISVPHHINLAWKHNYLWNGSVKTLDSLCLDDFGPEFFDTNKDTLYARLTHSTYYSSMFYKVFDVRNLYSLSYEELQQKIAYAITQFMRTLVSHDTKYEKFLNHHATLTDSEMRGFVIFNTERGDCFHCHGSILGTDNNYHNTKT